MRHQRLRAIMPGADRDPARVHNRADVVRMHPRHREADDPGAVVRAEQGDAVPPRELLAKAADQRAFVHVDRLDPDGVAIDRKSTRLNSSHYCASRMPYSACKNN